MIGKITYKEYGTVIKFHKKMGGYNFFPALCSLNECGTMVGRFDFDYKKSSNLTNKGFTAINKYKQIVFEMLEFLFEAGAEWIIIDAAPEKFEKRIILYKRVLSVKYNIHRRDKTSFYITKK